MHERHADRTLTVKSAMFHERIGDQSETFLDCLAAVVKHCLELGARLAPCWLTCCAWVASAGPLAQRRCPARHRRLRQTSASSIRTTCSIHGLTKGLKMTLMDDSGSSHGARLQQWVSSDVLQSHLTPAQPSSAPQLCITACAFQYMCRLQTHTRTHCVLHAACTMLTSRAASSTSDQLVSLRLSLSSFSVSDATPDT